MLSNRTKPSVCDLQRAFRSALPDSSSCVPSSFSKARGLQEPVHSERARASQSDGQTTGTYTIAGLMAERFIVEGGRRLEGTIRPGGNKNAALPILAACLLTDEPVVLRNLPDIQDVRVMLEIMEGLGASVERLESNVVRIEAKGEISSSPDIELSKKIRASILLAGPLLARCGRVSVAKPGGDAIGRRRVDTHLLALEALGAQIEVSAHEYRMETLALKGTKMFLDEASVTATENAIMAAVLAEGETIIYNAAAEPHVQDLCHMLNKMGAQIDG